jgi:peptide deformylase
MAILKVAQMGHPVLRQIAEPVPLEAIGSEALQALVQDMLETLDDYDGAGLAAPQVHEPLRLVCLTLSDEVGPEFWINPVLTPLTDELISGYEGCLSITGLRARVARYARIHVRYLALDGVEHSLDLQGFPAVVAQHECDHLDGILFIDKAEPLTVAFLDEYERWGAPETWSEEEELPN